MDQQLRKLVVVGDGGVGKTSLFIVLARGQFPTGYVPAVFDSHAINTDVNGECIKLELQDNSSRGDFYPLSYQYAHAFLICYAIDQPDSLGSVLKKWDPEVKNLVSGKAPRFLVGCKKDLRHDSTMLSELARYSQAPVTTEQGEDMAKVIGAEHFECSSKAGEGVRELFARVTERVRAGGGCIVV